MLIVFRCGKILHSPFHISRHYDYFAHNIAYKIIIVVEKRKNSLYNIK